MLEKLSHKPGNENDSFDIDIFRFDPRLLQSILIEKFIFGRGNQIYQLITNRIVFISSLN